MSLLTRSTWLPLLLFVSIAACGSKSSKPPNVARADASADGAGDGGASGDGAAGEGGTTVVLPGGPAVEECARRECNAGVSDLCCPASCTAGNDTDCGGCGNGRLEAGELCDPPGSCPQSCPQLKCEKRRLKSEGTCAAVCVSAGQQTTCMDGDECCPDGCNAANDRDCTATCGNGTVEPGELCDPLSSCPAACAARGCTLLTLKNPGSCLAHCVEAGQQSECRHDDGCCPMGCTAANDRDCAIRCDNGAIEGQETCDPLASCPTTCPAMGCRLRKLVNAGSCTAACIDDGLQTQCKSGDGCCPPGCNNSNDAECPVLCGNSVVETGESCDPISSCVAKELACVSDVTVVRTRMGDAGKCQFTCVEASRACGPSDGACPPGCGAAADRDCPGCGNGAIEPGETCDPVAQCRDQQQACVSDQSTMRTPGGDPDRCTFTCTQTPRPCGPADGNCPTGCTADRDADCAGCGNGRLDPGEMCDPAADCEERQRLCVSDANTIRTPEGDARNCRFICREQPRRCGAVDQQCPSGCGPIQDIDCPGCGNSRVEAGETCDPVADCEARARACVSDSNTIRTPAGSVESCTFACTAAPRPCGAADQHCPAECGPTRDVDCAGCGNGRVEAGETCDPLTSCPTECPAQGCQLRRLANAGTCTAQCVNAGTQAECKPGDGCCPNGCNATNDGDCMPMCGNGVLEAGETCEPPTACQAQSSACVSDNNFIRTRGGDPAKCTFTCTVTPRRCGDADGQCPSNCLPTQDADCAGCGNGRLDAGETCDPVAMCQEQARRCVSDDDTVRVGTGDPTMCTFACVATPRRCGDADGKCPTGCLPTQDVDCPGCGNGIVEKGETCDPVSVCEEKSKACESNADFIRTRGGDPGKCTFTCKETPRECGPADGFCPSTCPRANQDPDCKRAVLRFNPARWEVGPIPVGTSAREKFVLGNTGNGESGAVTVSVGGQIIVPAAVAPPLQTFKIVDTSCQGQSLPAGGQCGVVVEFVAAQGTFTDQLRATAAGGAMDQAALRGTGVVPAALSFKPEAVDFNRGTTRQVSVALINGGPGASGQLQVSLVDESPPGAFQVMNRNCPPAGLAPNTNCDLAVSFVATTTGQATARLLVNAPASASMAVLPLKAGGDIIITK
jgi:hypothetical protein